MDIAGDSLKRKRSPSVSAVNSSQHGSATPAPPNKLVKSSNQLSINYLARHFQEDLPLINKDDTMSNLLHLLSSYSNVLDRHESLASNLGARPLGPILIKRFERCFDNPPQVVTAHARGSVGVPDESAPTMTWLEVVEFARSHPTQFTLTSFSEGSRVCQFYYPQKQARVQVSEEDFLFINSGRCQELIPPLPIWEDEEKEFNTCDLLEIKLKELTTTADMLAARTRQLSHRLKGRKTAIVERRAEGGSGTPAKANAQQTTTAPPGSTGANTDAANGTRSSIDHRDLGQSASSAARSDLLRHFESLPHNNNNGGNTLKQITAHSRHQSIAGSVEPLHHAPRQSDVVTSHFAERVSNASSLSPVPPNIFASENGSHSLHDNSSLSRLNQHQKPQQHHRPPSSSAPVQPAGNSHSASKHNFSRPLAPALESSQPFRPLCQAHMDSLPRGHRVIPPCDRCRRLRMDCVKNLTSCAGCTRKHARCHWRDVSRGELGALDHLMDTVYPGSGDTAQPNGYADGDEHSDDHENGHMDSDDDDSNPLEDLEALGQKEEQEHRMAEEAKSTTDPVSPTNTTAPAHSATGNRETPAYNNTSSGKTEEAPINRTNGEHRDSEGNATIVAGKDSSIDKRDAHAGNTDTLNVRESSSSSFVSKRQNYDPVHDTPSAESKSKHISEKPERTFPDALLSYGGFRPVNNTLSLHENGHGWRAS